MRGLPGTDVANAAARRSAMTCTIVQTQRRHYICHLLLLLTAMYASHFMNSPRASDLVPDHTQWRLTGGCDGIRATMQARTRLTSSAGAPSAPAMNAA